MPKPKRKKTFARKKAKPREGLERAFNGGTWTLARMRSFVMSALRRAQWPQRHQALKKAFVDYGINPKTGRQCKLHRCEHCHGQFPQKDVHADHVEPVIPLQHDWVNGDQHLDYNWNDVIRRLYIEADGYQILCHACHSKVGDDERAARKL